MHFDDEYRRDVLEPARSAGDQPPEDLRARYRLREPLSPAEVTAQVKLVRQCWRRARGQLKYRKLIDRLEAEHRELAPLFAAAERGDPGPLRARLRGGAERTARRHAEARSRLLDAAGPLRMLAPADLEAIARSSGLVRADLEGVVAADRIEVRDPDRLPATPPYQGYPKAREALDVLGNRHLADFLFGARLRPTGPLRVLDGLHVPGVPDERAAAAAVAAVAAEWARRPRDTSATNADTVLVALKSAPLDELVRYDIVDRLRERHRQRASAGALLRFAEGDLGIEPGDARRLVFAVQRESGPAGGPAGRLRELLDSGAVHAAALFAESERLTEDAEALAAEARERVAAATRLREEAADCPDPDRAWRLLSDALRLVGDLPGAEELRRRLPPHPVARLDAAVDVTRRGTVVRLSWPATPSTAGEIEYRVVRQWDRPPRDATDGEPVASSGTTACDEDPPDNVPLFYAVVARRGEAATAPVVTGPIRVRPEPSGVELVAGDGVVTGRWRCPPAAARVLVTRGDGDPVPAERTGFRDAVTNGTTYHYRVAAVYLDEFGREVATPGVRRSATPSAPPDPVGEFTAEPDPGEPGRLLVGFAPPSRGTVELVLLPAPPPWPYGSAVPVTEVYRAGRRVPATPAPQGLVARPGGGGVLLAVTVSGDTAAIGAHRRHVDLPAPRGLVAQRRGATVHVGFDWPEQVGEVEVTYQIGMRDPRRVVVTRAGYDADGGLRLAVPEDEPVDVLVAASGVNGGARVVGAPVAATVAERTLVGYELDRAGPPWNRTVVITLAGRAVRIPRLLLVVRDGRVMPQRPEDGETIAIWTDLDLPARVSVPEPKRTGPFWLRCFTDDGVIELSDPPVRHLQVKK